eukprot:TRINITY_DN88820_c0_g1_i1.p2 TRINITY_DN88820_c0_g1~~TRINITY_DN88820_c0_g1_i1.p2  ORF type:complete len:146 (-),score=5.24 TRINITY_DN88820_c0_g1_i1:900-1337(-)
MQMELVSLELGRLLRGNDKPFGGIQLLIGGDFLQLPPIITVDNRTENLPTIYAFETEAWRKCIHQCVILSQVFRQADLQFVTMGNPSNQTLQALVQRIADSSDPPEPSDANKSMSTKLLSRRLVSLGYRTLLTRIDLFTGVMWAT